MVFYVGESSSGETSARDTGEAEVEYSTESDGDGGARGKKKRRPHPSKAPKRKRLKSAGESGAKGRTSHEGAPTEDTTVTPPAKSAPKPGGGKPERE